MLEISSVSKKFIGGVLIGLLGFVAAPNFAQSATLTSDAGASKAAPSVEQSTKGLLFEVKMGGKSAYLFGSLHIAKPDFYPMSPSVEAAYQQADTVAIEADTSNAAALQGIMGLLTYAAPDKLENHLTPATWASVKGIFGPAAEQFQTLRPALLTSAVLAEIGKTQGFDPMQGIDMHFIGRTKKDAKSLVELESLEFQGKLLGSLSDEDGDAMLSEFLDSLKKRELFNELNKLIDAWKSADEAKLAALLEESNNKNAAAKKLAKAMYDDRNEMMTEKIKKLVADGKRVFVVVGAGHLAGKNSVVDMLRKQGVEVNQIR